MRCCGGKELEMAEVKCGGWRLISAAKVSQKADSL